MGWKNHLAGQDVSRKNSVDGGQTLSARGAPTRNFHSPSQYGLGNYSNGQSATNLHLGNPNNQENIRNSGVKYSKRGLADDNLSANKIKQDTIRRVKMLQEKVLPMVSKDHTNGTGDYSELKNEEYDFAWQSRM